MATKGKLKTEMKGTDLTIAIPSEAPDKVASVIKVEFEGKVAPQSDIKPKKEMKTGALD
ncbi:hypothetical protein D3C86_2212910 [compost metagenome]